MARQFVALTQEEIDERTAQNIKSREAELLSYDFEKEHHEDAIAALGDISWSAENEKYRGMSRDAMIASAQADGLTDEQIQHISNLMSLDYHKHNLQAVKVETAKSERIYANTLKALPAGERRTAAFTALRAKEEAEKTKAG